MQSSGGDGSMMASDPHACLSARSSVGRERRRGILVLAGAVGAPVGPEGRDDDPAASGNSPNHALVFNCMNSCRKQFGDSARVRVHTKIGDFSF
jgi:hypothetical protein